MTVGKINTAGWILGGIVLYGVWQYIKFTNEETMKLTDIGFNGSYVDATFMINNPSDLSGTIDNLVGDLQYKGSRIATVNTNMQPITVPAGLPFPAKVKMQPNYTNIFTNAIQALTALTGFNKKDFRFVGTMRFDGIEFPVNTSLA